RVISRPAVENIAAGTADEPVVAGMPIQMIIAREADEDVVADAAVERIIARHASERLGDIRTDGDGGESVSGGSHRKDGVAVIPVEMHQSDERGSVEQRERAAAEAGVRDNTF